MAICGAKSIYQEYDQEWTYTCQADEEHEPGQHDYVLDDGQTPPPDPEA